VIDANNGAGVSLTAGSTLSLSGTTLRANAGSGLELQDTSVAVVGSGDNTITDNIGWGITCVRTPAVAQLSGPDGPPNVGTITGNTQGAIDCPYPS
jgi:hypothetical protein